jgi:hypothetical protein
MRQEKDEAEWGWKMRRKEDEVGRKTMWGERRRRCRFMADRVGRKTRHARLVGTGFSDLTVLDLGH